MTNFKIKQNLLKSLIIIFFLWFSILFVFFIYIPDSSATTLIYKDAPTLAKEAAKILRVKVLDTRSEWAPGKWTIYTYVTLVASDGAKGTFSDQPFLIRMEGGTVATRPCISRGYRSLSWSRNICFFSGTCGHQERVL